MALPNEDALIRRDRLRFTKNKASANLALLAIVFDCLYFVSIYRSNAGSWYYTLMMGISVVYNLIFMLLAFLVSEGSKNYLVQYSYFMIGLGVLQFVRIAILPAKAHAAVLETAGGAEPVMTGGQFAWESLCLVASGLCCLASAAVGIKKYGELQAHLSTMVESVNSEITS